MTGYVDPTKETFAAFRANERPGPIHMLNLVRLRDRAGYPHQAALRVREFVWHPVEPGLQLERRGAEVPVERFEAENLPVLATDHEGFWRRNVEPRQATRIEARHPVVAAVPRAELLPPRHPPGPHQ